MIKIYFLCSFILLVGWLYYFSKAVIDYLNACRKVKNMEKEKDNV